MSSTNHITRQPVPPTDSVRVKAAVAAHEAADAATDRRVDTTFDKFHDRYSTRSLGLKTSPVRALFAVANRPEVVSLAGGMPNIADLPLDVVSESLKELVDTRGTVVMQYGSGQGEPEMRKHICEVMAVEGSSQTLMTSLSRVVLSRAWISSRAFLQPKRRHYGRVAGLCRGAQYLRLVPN